MTRRQVPKGSKTPFKHSGNSVAKIASSFKYSPENNSWKKELLKPVGTPTNPPKSRFIGRVLMSNATDLESLRADFPTANFLTTEDNFAFNLMHRHILVDDRREPKILSTLFSRLANEGEVTIDFDRYAVKLKLKSQGWDVRFPVNVGYAKLKQEQEKTKKILAEYDVRSIYTPPMCLRIAEVHDEETGYEIAESVMSHIGKTAILGPPEILIVDRVTTS